MPPASILDKPVQFVRGVGPQRAKAFAEADIETVGDLITYFPFRFEEQPPPRPIESLDLDEMSTVIGVVDTVNWRGGPFRRAGRDVLHVTINDGTGRLRITWFNATYLRDRIQRGQVLRLFGKVEVEGDLARFTNPRVEWLDPHADSATWGGTRLVPIYRAIGRLVSPRIARVISSILDEAVPSLSEPLPDYLVGNRRLLSRRSAIMVMHRPVSLAEVEPARHRLAYEELLMMQVAVMLQRAWVARSGRAPALPLTEKIDQRIRRRFPFKLTMAQDRVIREVTTDLGRTHPMTRLLQGDVGSGKTVVALYAALVAVAQRHQCVILAPTEVLANQHFAGIEKYLEGSRVRRCLLTGKVSPTHRRKVLAAIGKGDMDLVVGTQALLESKLQFLNLGLVIVDEQHKFGVSQRATLKHARRIDGAAGAITSIPHYLVMTATPIPRTLSMTVFGDLDVSIIDQLPPGRQPIVTRLVLPAMENQAWTAVRRRIAQGEQVYVVYPLVEESESLDLKAATAEVERVGRVLLPGARVGLLHGRMKKDEKNSIMRDFTAGRIDVLVSTTVIEVGVDVPNATVMAIQHAERYGLSALHQLRGRVGRGTKPSMCLLMSDPKSDIARRRLRVLCDTTDGFRIAEEDLALRGPGELLGTRQHGFPEFRVANLIRDVDLLMMARDDAGRIVRSDPSLRLPEHAALRDELRRRFRDTIAFIHVA